MAGGPNLQIEVQRGAGKTTVTMTGIVDELAEFDALSNLDGQVEINLRGLRRFNSAGVRVWVDAVRELCKNANVKFVEIAPTVVDQLNMIQGFLGHGTVVSFMAPMVCPICDEEEMSLFEAHACRQDDRLTETRCPKCGGIMELDDNEDSFLLFLREPTGVVPW